MLPADSYLFVPNALPPSQEDEVFPGIDEKDLSELRQLFIPIACRRRTVLCMEGQPGDGIFIVRSGRVKEVMLSCEGKALIVRIAGRGDILGLSAVISERAYETSAEALEPVQVDFVPGDKFRRLLKTSEVLGRIVVDQLSRTCSNAYNGIRRLALSSTVPERLASFVLQWAESCSLNGNANPELHIRVFLNHEEIAQALGSTRESVSRALNSFQKHGWIKIKGGTWRIMDKPALEALSRMDRRVRNDLAFSLPVATAVSSSPQLPAVAQPES